VGPDKFRLSLIGMANPGKEKRFAFKRRGSPVRYVIFLLFFGCDISGIYVHYVYKIVF